MRELVNGVDVKAFHNKSKTNLVIEGEYRCTSLETLLNRTLDQICFFAIENNEETKKGADKEEFSPSSKTSPSHPSGENSPTRHEHQTTDFSAYGWESSSPFSAVCLSQETSAQAVNPVSNTEILSEISHGHDVNTEDQEKEVTLKDGFVDEKKSFYSDEKQKLVTAEEKKGSAALSNSDKFLGKSKPERPDAEALLSMYKTMSAKNIAEKYHVSTSTVYGWLKKARKITGKEKDSETQTQSQSSGTGGIKPKRKKCLDIGKIMALSEAGWDTKAIADEMKSGEKIIKVCLQKIHAGELQKEDIVWL